MECSRALSVFLFSILVRGALSAPSADEVTDLPGLSYTPNFKHYSGYLDGSSGDHLHYWFTESQGNASKDPLLLWMNGGPGCSSLLGLLTELGPFRINEDGSGVDDNPYSWNKVANVLFLEAPVCVGYSYADNNENCTTGDNQTALSNYLALKDFFLKFPEYRDHDFYLSGESYAGIYVPTLAVLVVDGNDTFPINLKGYAVGNGLYSYETNDNSVIFYAYDHGVLGQELWDDLVTNCCDESIADRDHCDFTSEDSERPCDVAVKKARQIIFWDGINPYDIYGMCYRFNFTESGQNNRLSTSLKNRRGKISTSKDSRIDPLNLVCFFPSDESCRIYLNDNATRNALHIPENVGHWDVCSDLDYAQELDDDYYHLSYLQEKNVRALIYNGDCDSVCNVVGNTWDVDQMQLNIVEGHKKWLESEEQQVGGFVTRYENLDFVTVRGAGHMVPETRPSQSLQMITAFLNNQPYGAFDCNCVTEINGAQTCGMQTANYLTSNQPIRRENYQLNDWKNYRVANNGTIARVAYSNIIF